MNFLEVLEFKKKIKIFLKILNINGLKNNQLRNIWGIIN